MTTSPRSNSTEVVRSARFTRQREAMLNLGLAVASALFFLAICEFFVFRIVLPGSDVPRNALINDVVRYAPGQTGVWRVRDDIAAPFSINAQGWNSPLADYATERRPGVSRIAFVGDSFVEALQVPVSMSFVEDVAQAMSGERPVETYRFGISGAPLSQYVHMVEREVARFRPDRIVVVLVHNDFDESFVLRPGRYTSSFLKFNIANGRFLGELPPEPWRPGALEFLRRTVIARYFLYRWQVRPQTLADFFLGPARASDPRYAANIDVSEVLPREADIRVATHYAFARLSALASSAGASLHLVMDGDRGAIQAGVVSSPALVLNAIVADTARAQGLPFLDLHPVFAADWAKQQKRFDFPSDAHWNAHGHQVAARAIAQFLLAPPP